MLTQILFLLIKIQNIGQMTNIHVKSYETITFIVSTYYVETLHKKPVKYQEGLLSSTHKI